MVKKIDELKLLQMGDSDEWYFQYITSNNAINEEFNRALDFLYENKYEISETLLTSIIDRNLSHIDALHHLSLICEETSRDHEAYLYCREAVRVGLDVIPSNFNWLESKLEWGLMENRPFMRAYHNLGLWHQKRREVDSAIDIFSHLLSISPNDNLGVRLTLPHLWLEKGDILSVIRHCENLSEEYSPEILYTYPLALIISGDISKAKKLLQNAKKEFPLVAKELLKKQHIQPKSSMQGYISHGGADQAYEYWSDYGSYWNNNKDAMELLAKA